jgi:hypothetical protein
MLAGAGRAEIELPRRPPGLQVRNDFARLLPRLPLACNGGVGLSQLESLAPPSITMTRQDEQKWAVPV